MTESQFTFKTTFTIQEVLGFETGKQTLRHVLVDAAWETARQKCEAQNKRALFWAIEDLAGERFETEIKTDGEHLDVVIRDKFPTEPLPEFLPSANEILIPFPSCWNCGESDPGGQDDVAYCHKCGWSKPLVLKGKLQ
jgi:hypothetical protein